ncbi:hypothetical protein [Cryobacterium sp. PAMC25264]|uniref:hypothetical protein n=1 Tax=Cryobacterium sp. PAMC25264 TaxID=2861288 RepID=UPI00210284EE
MNFSPDEAVAVAIALRGLSGTPFHQTGSMALRKLLVAMLRGFDASGSGRRAGSGDRW